MPNSSGKPDGRKTWTGPGMDSGTAGSLANTGKLSNVLGGGALLFRGTQGPLLALLCPAECPSGQWFSLARKLHSAHTVFLSVPLSDPEAEYSSWKCVWC